MSSREIDSPLYSVPDAAKYLHTDLNLVRKAIDLGYLPIFDFGSRKVYRPEMDKFIIKYMGSGRGERLEELIKRGEKQQELSDDGERRISI